MYLDPFFEEMFRRMERAFSGIEKELGEIRPFTDLSETDDSIIVKMDMPGLNKEDINIKVTESSVEVKGKKKEEKIVEKENYYKRERAYKGYSQYLTLPCKIDINSVKAEYENGVLKIKAKKLETGKKGREIKIE